MHMGRKGPVESGAGHVVTMNLDLASCFIDLVLIFHPDKLTVSQECSHF